VAKRTNKENRARLSGRDGLANVAIVVLSIVLVGVFAAFLGSIKMSETSYAVSPESMLSNIRTGRYDTLVSYWKENVASGHDVDSDPNFKEPYAVAEYYDSAFKYRICLETGDKARADELLAIMEEDVEKMGDLVFCVDEIDSIVGID